MTYLTELIKSVGGIVGGKKGGVQVTDPKKEDIHMGAGQPVRKA